MTIADAARVKREILLRTMFPSMPMAAHVRFTELLEEVEVEAQATLFDIGDVPDRFWFLVEGQLVMESPDDAPWTFGPMSVVGMIDAVLQRPRTRRGLVLEPSKFLAIRVKDWFDMIEDNGQIARAAIRNFSTQMHLRWRQLAPRLLRRSEPPAAPLPLGFDSYDKILALRQATFLRDAGMQAIVSLAAVSEIVTLPAQQMLFEAGTEPAHLFVLAHGSVDLFQGQDFNFRHVPGDLLGGPGALCRALSAYSARAASDSVVLRIAEQDFYDRAEEHARLTRGTLSYLVQEFEPLLRLEPLAPRVARTHAEITTGA